jgi:hypothetical protein
LLVSPSLLSPLSGKKFIRGGSPLGSRLPLGKMFKRDGQLLESRGALRGAGKELRPREILWSLHLRLNLGDEWDVEEFATFTPKYSSRTCPLASRVQLVPIPRSQLKIP